MAGNYWESTQYQHWFFTPDKLAEIRDEIRRIDSKAIEQHPFPDRRLMLIYIRDRILQLAKRLPFRQQCVATAMVYIHRYLLSTPLQTVNLYLLVATAFYLASKTEESPHHIRLVASEARQAWPEYMSGDMTRIGEMEFSLISEMHSRLIVWHPYRTLEEMKQDADFKLTPDEAGFAWSIINDTYMTDLPLTCHPHIIAMTAVLIAIAFAPPKQGVIGHPFSLSQESDSDRFPSMGGRLGIGGMANARAQEAISRMQGHQLPNHPMSQSNSQGSHNGTNGTNGPNGSTRNGSVDPSAAALASERNQMFIQFLAKSDLGIEDMIEATQEIISLYEVWEQYNEKSIRDTVARCLKSRGLDS